LSNRKETVMDSLASDYLNDPNPDNDDRTFVCKYCGFPVLRWRYISGKYKPIERNGELHKCRKQYAIGFVSDPIQYAIDTLERVTR